MEPTTASTTDGGGRRSAQLGWPPCNRRKHRLYVFAMFGQSASQSSAPRFQHRRTLDLGLRGRGVVWGTCRSWLNPGGLQAKISTRSSGSVSEPTGPPHKRVRSLQVILRKRRTDTLDASCTEGYCATTAGSRHLDQGCRNDGSPAHLTMAIC